jgi:hypothetical protein
LEFNWNSTNSLPPSEISLSPKFLGYPMEFQRIFSIAKPIAKLLSPSYRPRIGLFQA